MENGIEVVDRTGTRGVMITSARDNATHLAVRLENGSELMVAREALVELKDGGFYFPHQFNAMQSAGEAANPPRSNYAEANYSRWTDGASSMQNETSTGTPAVSNDEIVVPVIAEEINIERRQVKTGGVRVQKVVHAEQQTVDEPTFAEQVEVERVAVNQVVDAAPPVRYEGDVMIVPILEEVLVVEKRLVVREELRIAKRRVASRNPQTVTLRREEVIAERIAANNSDG